MAAWHCFSKSLDHSDITVSGVQAIVFLLAVDGNSSPIKFIRIVGAYAVSF